MDEQRLKVRSTVQGLRHVVHPCWFDEMSPLFAEPTRMSTNLILRGTNLGGAWNRVISLTGGEILLDQSVWDRQALGAGFRPLSRRVFSRPS